MHQLRNLLLGFAASLCLASHPEAAELSLSNGDTVEISVLGMPELQKRALVDEGGDVTYPLLGPVRAAGLSTAELRTKLRDLLIGQNLLKDPRIGIEIISRRPITVAGDVLRPGAQPYSIDLTVRGAVALAGGLDPIGQRGAQVLVNPADLEGQAETLALDLARQKLRLRLLEAEAKNNRVIETDGLEGQYVTSAIVARLAELARQELAIRLDAAENDRSSLAVIIRQLQAQLASLGERRAAEEESVRQEMDQIAKVKALADSGITVQGRLLEEQRAMLLVKSRLYDTLSVSAMTQRLLAESNRKVQALDETRMLAVLNETQTTYAGVAETTARLAAVQRQMGSKRTAGLLRYTLYRRENNLQIRIDADQDTAVMPGDIVEVSFESGEAVASH